MPAGGRSATVLRFPEPGCDTGTPAGQSLNGSGRGGSCSTTSRARCSTACMSWSAGTRRTASTALLASSGYVRSRRRLADFWHCGLPPHQPGQVSRSWTSGGYSALWLALACRASGRGPHHLRCLAGKGHTCPRDLHAGADRRRSPPRRGDFLEHASEFDEVGFCFLDAEKELYGAC